MGETQEDDIVGFSSIRHIAVYLASDMMTPVAACSMTKARILIKEYAAKLQTINGRSGISIDSADVLKAHLGPHLQLLSLNEAGTSAAATVDRPPAPPASCHRPMNDREVMEHMVRAGYLTAHVQGGLDDRTLVEIREIRQRLSDAIPGMTFPRPTGGPIASKLNQILQIFSQAQADKKLDDMEVIRKVQALTW